MTDVTSETLPMALTKGRDVPRMARELRKGHHGHLREFVRTVRADSRWKRAVDHLLTISRHKGQCRSLAQVSDSNGSYGGRSRPVQLPHSGAALSSAWSN